MLFIIVRLLVCALIFVNWCLQEFYGLIDTIGEVLTGLVDDPYLIAYDVAEFERTLSEVSHRVENNRLFMLCFILRVS